MAGDDELAPPVAAPAAAAKRVGPPRPTITLPPRAPMGALFSDGGFGLAGMGFSPGPITLISSLFSPTDECKSFSQLLAGAMASPAAHRVDDGQSGFKQSWPDGLLSSPAAAMFMVPPGLSPATLLDSPGFFSPRQGPFGMTHQEALAQVTAQAVAQAQSQIQNQTVENTALMTQAAVPQQKSSISDSRVAILEPKVFPKQQEQNSQPMSFAGDNKPANDGYNWRKYGQKNVKGSECPRSYYKCSQPGCPVKKKVEHGFDGHIKEIIYKGQHNHLPPQKNKRAKEALTAEHSNSVLRKDQEFSEVAPEHSTATTDSEEVDDGATGNGGRDEDEPEPKRRNTEIQVSETASSQQTVTESRIIVQTRSEVDLLDDGYKWRKYGQKVVKGNPYPRSYYKCTTPGCNVRKHVERAAADPKSVVTTYEGKHNHTVPAAKISGHSIVNSSTSLQKPNPTTGGKHQLTKDLKTDMQKTNVQPIGRLRLKDEQIR